MLPEFDFWLPQTLDEALQHLSAAVSGASAVAGGTNVVPDLRSGRHVPQILVDISRLSELYGIQEIGDQVVVGSCVTVGELLRSPIINRYAPPLVSAAGTFASPLVRNRATVGGNLVDASPAADTAPPLLALDAQVELTSKSGKRTVPLADFFTGVRKTVRKADELVTAVRWTKAENGPRRAFRYYKLGLRKADAISVVSLAMQVQVDDKGICTLARIAFGSVAPTPIRARKAEQALMGKPFDAQAIAEASQLAAAEVNPISDLRASADYRRRMVGVMTKRYLTQIFEQFNSGE